MATILGIMMSASVWAGNAANTTRTLTTGIGSGTTHGRIPGSHPGTKSRAASYRNSRAADYQSKYRNGLRHRPSGTVLTGSASTSRSGNPPSSVPGADRWNENAEASARSRIPASLPPGGGREIPDRPSSVGTDLSSSTGSGRPETIRPSLPDASSAGRVPSSIPPASTGGGMPDSIPDMPDLPGAATSRMPDAATSALDHRGGARP
jgi:hypothetical protein